MRVAFVPRSAEIQPLFWRFVTFIPSQPSSSSSSHCILILAITICCCRSIWPYTTYPSSSYIDLHNIKHIEWCTSYIMYIVHSFNQHQKSSYPLLLSGVTTINHSSSQSSRPSHHRKKDRKSILAYCLTVVNLMSNAIDVTREPSRWTPSRARLLVWGVDF